MASPDTTEKRKIRSKLGRERDIQGMKEVAREQPTWEEGSGSRWKTREGKVETLRERLVPRDAPVFDKEKLVERMTKAAETQRQPDCL